MPNDGGKGGALAGTAEWFERAVPVPSPKNLQTQMGVHFEEVAEMLDTLVAHNANAAFMLREARLTLKDLAQYLKASDPDVVTIRPESEQDMLDALCDQIVTATGVAHMKSYNLLGAMDEVNASNWSKFVDGQPIFDANMKIQKGPGYFKADLAPFVKDLLLTR